MHRALAMPLALDDQSQHDPGAPAVPPIAETELDRITKLVPAELLIFYASATPTLSAETLPHLRISLFAVGCVLAPVILFLDGRATGKRARWPQYAVRTLAFAAIASAIAWPFEVWIAGSSLQWLRSLAALAVPFVGAVLLRERHDDDPY